METTPPETKPDSIHPDEGGLPTGSDSVLAWCMAAVDESEQFVRAQPGVTRIDECLAALTGEDESPYISKMGPNPSKTRTNRAAKATEDLVAMLTDTKPAWQYTTNNRRFEQQADIMGKLATYWHQATSFDLRLGDVIQWSTAAGTGYLYLCYDPELGDTTALALDPRNVLPIRPVRYESVESWQGVVIKQTMPVTHIRSQYGVKVEPETTEGSQSWIVRAAGVTSDIASPIHQWAPGGSKASRTHQKIPSCTLYTMFLKDPRTNKGSFPVEMGKWTTNSAGKRVPTNNWSYLVMPGEPLFPNRRMITWVGKHILYDGPSYYWHGKFPIHKLTLSPMPWSFMGRSTVAELIPLNQSLNRTLRVIDDHLAQVAQPGVVADKRTVSESVLQKFNTRDAGYKLRQNPQAGPGIVIQNPPPLPADVWKMVEFLQSEINQIAGIMDAQQMLTMNQMPSDQTIERIMSTMSPQIRRRSRIMEEFMRGIAHQLIYNFAQFYSLPKRCAILGPGGIVIQDFDFDPGTLIPDFAGDADFAPDGSLRPEALIRGPLPLMKRAKQLLEQFVYQVTPSSLLASAQLEQKLIYLQLARAGWMDIFTLWNILGIPNTGVLPDNVRTIPERIAYQNQLGLSGSVNPAGRKASGAETPRVVTKESS